MRPDGAPASLSLLSFSRAALLASVDPVPALAGRVSSGGRLNVAQALAALRGITASAPRLTCALRTAAHLNDRSPPAAAAAAANQC
jgi:hypothetical protein